MKRRSLLGGRALALVLVATAANPGAGGAMVLAQSHSGGGTSASPFTPRAIDMPASRIDVPMELVQGSRATVRVMVNSVGPFLFAIETGAPVVMITERIATAAHLTKRSLLSMLFHGPTVTVDSLRIGDAVLRDLPAITGPEFIAGVDGLLGLPAYAGVLMTVDYPGQRVVFERGALPEPDDREVFPMVAIGPFVGVTVTIGGRRLSAMIDTQGGTDIGVVPEIADGLRFASPLVTVGQVRIGGRATAADRAARLDGDLRIGDFTMIRPIVHVHDAPPGYPQQVLLGSEVLRHFSVTLDQVNQRVRFQRQARELPPAPPIRSIGLTLAPAAEGVVVIARVTDGGVAANAGLRVGDVVIEVAHRPAREFLTSYELATLVQRGEATHVEISRGGRRISVDLTPRMLVQ